MFAIALQSMCQIKVPMGSKAEVEKFYNTTTYVVLKNEFMSDYNDKIKEAVEAHWTITPYKFVKASEFEKLRHDDDKSFLVVNIVYFDDDKSDTKFDFLILSLGGSKYKTVNDMPTLCAVPLCYNGDEDEEKYTYKLGAMVKHCQTHVGICREHPELTKETIMKYYENNFPSPENKKLCLIKDEVAQELQSTAALKAAYPHEVEFVTSEQIENLIGKDDNKALIAHIIKPLPNSKMQYCVKIFIDVKQGMLYSYSAQKLKKSTDGLIQSDDLKKLSKK